MTDQTLDNNPARCIFRIGGLICILLFLYSVSTLVIMSLIGGPPETVQQCFEMLKENKFLGLLRLDLLTFIFMPLYYLLFYAFFVALNKTASYLVAISTILVFAGLTLFLATPSVFSLLHLSEKFLSAASDSEKNQLLAAGEAIIASDIWHGTGPKIGGLLLQTGALLISVSMLKGNVFNRATAVTGIATHGLDLLHVIIGFIIPAIANYVMFIAGPLYFLWFPLVGIRFFRLSKKSGILD